MSGGIINSGNFAKALWPGINAWYGKSYQEYQPQWKDLFETQNSKRAYEEDVGISSLGLASVKSEGNSIIYDDETQAFVTRYTHVVYALGFIITREMYEDDLYGVTSAANRRANGLSFSMNQTKEIVGSNVYNNGFNSAFLGGDGVSLFNSAHPNFAGGTWSNQLSVAADLSEASLEQMCIDIMAFTDDRGLRISVMPQTLHIPRDLVFEAERILHSPYRVGTANNDVNALYSMGKFPGGIKVNQYFSDQDAYFIRTNVPNGMKMFERRNRELTMDNDFDTENAKYKATDRYSFGWTDPRSAFGTPGA